MLRPYVFMAQRYELFHAPWTIQDLPLARPDHQSNGVDLNSLVRGPWITDLIPKSRAVEIEMYGRKVSICPPLLAHAAILRFFSKKMPGEMVENLMSPLLAMNRDDEGESRMRLEMDVDEDDDEHMMAEAGTSQSLILDSRQHDRDFQRLASCYNPSLCRGMKRAVFRGSWEGCWEGNFSFFDFDAFGLMMAGQSSALYEGPYGEQAQVWRLKETFVRPKRSHKGKARAGTLPVRGPMTNAGFPTTDQYQGLNAGYQPPSRTTGWASAAAEALTMQDTIRQLVGAFDEYEIVPDDEVEHALADGGGEEAGLEMILSGTGHSAWGRFVIKGRVRAWDGLASIVKEYTVSQPQHG